MSWTPTTYLHFKAVSTIPRTSSGSGAFTQEDVDDVFGNAVAGVHDHQADGRAGSGVDGQRRELLGNGSDQDARRGDGIGDAVGSCRIVDAGIDFLADIAVYRCTSRP